MNENTKYEEILKRGKDYWNKFRDNNPLDCPQLIRSDLNKMDLTDYNFEETNFFRSDIKESNFENANLKNANLGRTNAEGSIFKNSNLTNSNFWRSNLKNAVFSKATLFQTNFRRANLMNVDFSEMTLHLVNFSKANLSKTNLCCTSMTNSILIDAIVSNSSLHNAKLNNSNLEGAIFDHSNLNKADFSSVNLTKSRFIESNLDGAIFNNSRIYGISAWNLVISSSTQQRNLIITKEDEPTITTDNIEVAQFIYLLLNNSKIRNIIDTITSKVVLILGRFTSKRKKVLDLIREEFRKHDYLPVIFDFDVPARRDTQETLTTLARLARFIIADITDAKCIPQELVSIVQTLPSVPVLPIMLKGEQPWGMYDHIKRYPWVIDIILYQNSDLLINDIKSNIICTLEKKVKELL